MNAKIKNILSHLFFLILGVFIGLNSCVGSRSANMPDDIKPFFIGSVYGLKLIQPNENKVKINSTNLNLDDLKDRFIERYNELAASKSIQSKATSNGNGISIYIYQRSWRSPWYTDVDFRVLKGLNSGFLETSFNFIYGPDKKDNLLKTQGENALNQINELIISALKSLSKENA